jgi:hypothetical protein
VLVCRHHTIGHYVEYREEILPDPPQEEQVVVPLEEDTSSVVASIVEMVVLACAQLRIALRHRFLPTRHRMSWRHPMSRLVVALEDDIRLLTCVRVGTEASDVLKTSDV